MMMGLCVNELVLLNASSAETADRSIESVLRESCSASCVLVVVVAVTALVVKVFALISLDGMVCRLTGLDSGRTMPVGFVLVLDDLGTAGLYSLLLLVLLTLLLPAAFVESAAIGGSINRRSPVMYCIAACTVTRLKLRS